MFNFLSHLIDTYKGQLNKGQISIAQYQELVSSNIYNNLKYNAINADQYHRLINMAIV